MKETIDIFKALADKTRLKIALYLVSVGEVSCKVISKKFLLSQPTLSHHFNKLIAAGVILERKEGVSHFYRINEKFIRKSGFNLKQVKF